MMMMNSRVRLIKKLPKWNTLIIAQEALLKMNYALRNKRELQRVYYELSRIRRVKPDNIDHPRMYQKLIKTGLLKRGDSVLELTTTSFLQRRLQTVLSRLFDITLRQSRQLIAHNHVMLDGHVLRSQPSQLINTADENKLSIRPRIVSALGINTRTPLEVKNE
jgi:ribosomal protein S4